MYRNTCITLQYGVTTVTSFSVLYLIKEKEKKESWSVSCVYMSLRLRFAFDKTINQNGNQNCILFSVIRTTYETLKQKKIRFQFCWNFYVRTTNLIIPNKNLQ